MLSPAQRHRARVLQEKAQQQAAAADPHGELTGDAYHLMLVKLAADRRRLKEIQSITRKCEVKVQLLPDYIDWIATALQTGTGAQDQVLSTCMVWAIDAGAYSLALDIAAYVLRHGLALPDQYERTPAVVVVDELAGAYLTGKWAPLEVGTDVEGKPALLDLYTSGSVDEQLATSARLLMRALELTADFDAPDQARAKLHKAIAYAALGKVQTAEDVDLATLPIDRLTVAQEHLQRALKLDGNSGVKKDIERVERRLASGGTAADHDAVTDTADTTDAPAADTADTSTTTEQPADTAKARPTRRASAKSRGN